MPIQDFTAAGTTAWQVPAGVTTLLYIEALGGGGASGAATGNPAVGGGGAGGAYARKDNVAVTALESLSVVVGSGGATVSDGNGGAGDVSGVHRGGTYLCRASGGGGGLAATANGSGGAAGQGTTGSNIGDTNHRGGHGAAGVASTLSGAGGGGAWGAQGGDASVDVGGTAAAPAGAGANAVANNSAGASGSLYGGGASGGRAGNNTNRQGAAGMQGMVRIAWDTPSYTASGDASGSYGSAGTATHQRSLTASGSGGASYGSSGTAEKGKVASGSGGATYGSAGTGTHQRGLTASGDASASYGSAGTATNGGPAPPGGIGNIFESGLLHGAFATDSTRRRYRRIAGKAIIYTEGAMRDYRLTDTAYFEFSTNDTTGAAVAPTSPSAWIYDEGSLTEITAGVTVSTSWDGRVGLNMVTVVIATAGLVAGRRYKVGVEATVGGVTARRWLDPFSVELETATVAYGALSAGGATSFTLPAGQWDRVKVGDIIEVISGTGKGTQIILTYNPATGAGTVSGWTTAVAAGTVVRVTRAVNGEPLAATDFSAGAITAIQSGLATSANQTSILGRLPAALVSGRMDSSVGAMAANTMNASALAADAVSEIQSGLATSAAQTTAQTDLTTIKGYIDTEIASILGFIDTEVAAIQAAVDTEVAAIKAVTDKVNGMLEVDGAVNRFTANALEQAPTGGGGGVVTGFTDDAISAAAISAAAVAKIQAGLATAAALANAQTLLDSISGRLPAALVGGKMDANATATVDAGTITAIVSAIFSHLIESGLTFENAMRILAAVFMGKNVNVTGAAPEFYSADVVGNGVVGSRLRMSSTRESDGDRLTITLDFTPT